MSDWSILWCSFETKIRDYILSKNFNTDVYFDYSTEIVNSDKEFYKLDILTKNKSMMDFLYFIEQNGVIGRRKNV